MPRQRIATASPFEKLASYSRAVVDGDMIYVSGTVGLDYATQRIAGGAAEQTEQALRNIAEALDRRPAPRWPTCCAFASSSPTGPISWTVCQVIGRHFKDVLPANTTVVSQLATAEMKVEIEVTARRGSADPR